MRQVLKGLLAGIIFTVVFGGAVVYGAVQSQLIEVVYVPLKYYFDGVEKTPPADQKGFIFNGRTYVPLRFFAESMGSKAEYDANTTSIYVGRRPNNGQGTPFAWDKPFNDEVWGTNVATTHNAVFHKEGAKNVYGQEMPNAFLFQATCSYPYWVCKDGITKVQDHILNGLYEKLSGTLFVPSLYLGNAGNRTVGRITILDGDGNSLYESPALKANADNPTIPFEVNVKGVARVRVILWVQPMEGPSTSAQIGVSDMRLY